MSGAEGVLTQRRLRDHITLSRAFLEQKVPDTCEGVPNAEMCKYDANVSSANPEKRLGM